MGWDGKGWRVRLRILGVLSFVCFYNSKIISVFVSFSFIMTVTLNFIVLLPLEDDVTFCPERFPGSWKGKGQVWNEGKHREGCGLWRNSQQLIWVTTQATDTVSLRLCLPSFMWTTKESQVDLMPRKYLFLGFCIKVGTLLCSIVSLGLLWFPTQREAVRCFVTGFRIASRKLMA